MAVTGIDFTLNKERFWECWEGGYDGIDVDASVNRYEQLLSERLQHAHPGADIDVHAPEGGPERTYVFYSADVTGIENDDRERIDGMAEDLMLSYDWIVEE